MEGITLAEAGEAVSGFIERGGTVLVILFGVTLLMWTLILERTLYIRLSYPRYRRAALSEWERRGDKTSWSAEQIRRMMTAQVKERLDHATNMIKTCVAVCPLLGLLGTVTGMIEVFDVMAVAGNGNPRAMASGVSMATIPTMAGMVAALSGFYPSVQLKKYATDETMRFGDKLTS